MDDVGRVAKRCGGHDGWLFLPFITSSSTRQACSEAYNDGLQELEITSAFQVRLDDGPPQHVCLKCKRELQTLESC